MSLARVEHRTGVGTAAQAVAAAALSRVLVLVRRHQDMTECPKCGAPGLCRSQVRRYERLWKAVSSSLPYRCRGCGTRVWGSVRTNDAAKVAASANLVKHVPLDLTAVDELLRLR